MGQLPWENVAFHLGGPHLISHSCTSIGLVIQQTFINRLLCARSQSFLGTHHTQSTVLGVCVAVFSLTVSGIQKVFHKAFLEKERDRGAGLSSHMKRHFPSSVLWSCLSQGFIYLFSLLDSPRKKRYSNEKGKIPIPFFAFCIHAQWV